MLFALCGAHFSQVVGGCQPYYAFNYKYYDNLSKIVVYPLLNGLFWQISASDMSVSLGLVLNSINSHLNRENHSFVGAGYQLTPFNLTR